MAVSSFSNSGIKSGSKRNKIWDQSTILNSFSSIATQTVGAGGAPFVLFENIPQTYTHLQIRGILGATTNGTPYIQFNNEVTGTNYSWHHLFTSGSAVNANGGVNQEFCYFHYLTSSGFGGSFVMDILDYSNSNKHKTLRTISGFENNGSSSEMALWSGNWRSTAGINTIKITAAAGNFLQYTSFALYGVKA